MILIKILKLDNGSKTDAVIIKAIIGTAEFKQLQGNLNKLCIFPAMTIAEPASVTKTGARHSYAKYLLLPVTLRRQYKTEGYDFDHTRCGTISYQDNLYIIYSVPKKSLATPKNHTGNETGIHTPDDHKPTPTESR